MGVDARWRCALAGAANTNVTTLRTKSLLIMGVERRIGFADRVSAKRELQLPDDLDQPYITNSPGPARVGVADAVTIVTAGQLIRRLVGEGRPRFSAAALTRCIRVQSTFA
jgi:hypothetical protein